MNKVTLGGDRLGSGNKQKIELHGYERSTHDLSYLWRSTMASGTLVPFMSEVGLPGDNFEIKLDVDMKTHPTIGPLFGSYKVQLDVFQCPIRLYNGKLHMNLLNIGLNMNQIKLPQVEINADGTATGDNGQINPSALLSYLNVRGVGKGAGQITRRFNAIPYLAYWDIYKNYYANKQEEIGMYIHNPQGYEANAVTQFQLIVYDNTTFNLTTTEVDNFKRLKLGPGVTCGTIQFANAYEPVIAEIGVSVNQNAARPITEIFNVVEWDSITQTITLKEPKDTFDGVEHWYKYYYTGNTVVNDERYIKLVSFPLTNIDDMRESILVSTSNAGAFIIDEDTDAPYGPPLKEGVSGYSLTSTQEGLGVKTYQSDLFNNWISTDWIEGPNGINEVTAVDTSSGEFTINTLQLSNKVYDMLNRIAVSGGSYDDWLSAVYSHERTRSQENPMYMGGLIRELAFQEVISNAAATNESTEQPLGTLAGRGVLTNKEKGGYISVKINEPSYIMGIISLTPRVDYSQGNKWDVNLKTLDDLHKPGLDEIGFQDLITDQMAWWDTEVIAGVPQYKSAGKQPAWVNYMTNVNQTRGNFAEKNEQMFMTLNRRYEEELGTGILDLTTYVDPAKFNNIFADTRLDAQNFWAQIAVNITARRKMSAKVMPNL